MTLSFATRADVIAIVRVAILVLFGSSLFVASLQAQRPASPSASSITGVYKGIYSCQDVPLNLTISLISTADGSLSGFIIINQPQYPPYSGARNVYKLTGRYVPAVGHLSINSEAVGTPLPAEFSLVHLDAVYHSFYDMISGNLGGRSCTEFHADRDKAHTPSSVAADVETIVAWNREHPAASVPDQRSSTAGSAQNGAGSAPKGAAQKPKSYWSVYSSDLIRRVYEGDFRFNVESTKEFPVLAFPTLFNTYVDIFSRDCRKYLPAHHDSLVITDQKTNESTTVEMDPRFTEKYRQYYTAQAQGGVGLNAVLGALSGKADPFAPGLDVMKFFQLEGCQSPAMHQLGENLLLAVRDSSTDQAGDDESGPSSHFLQACIAYYHAPGRNYYSHDIDWCHCLARHYRGLMTPDEQAKYSHDFEHLFFDVIAQPWGYKKDPAWGRLHPTVDKCAADASQ